MLSLSKPSRCDVKRVGGYAEVVVIATGLDSLEFSVCRGPGSHLGGMMEKLVSVLPPLRFLRSFQGHVLWEQLHSLHSMCPVKE